MTPLDITWLHVESSSKCNAWCPACPRNNNGFGLSSSVESETDLPTARFNDVLLQLTNLRTVQFCGNYGDPVVGANFDELVDICMSKNLKIQVHTNGSLRNEQWWANLGTKLANYDHDIWFGLDGIGETHEIYRQATSYDKIIKNAEAFISAGGYATWQFIPYQHNQHQIKEAIITSQKLKFKKFKLVKIFRNKKTARHWKSGNTFELHPPDDIVKLIALPGKKLPPSPDMCMHLSPDPSVYLNAQGKISWCCYRNSESVDTLEQLFQTELALDHKNCIINCGRTDS